MELNTRVPPFTQTFLKHYCDRKAWKIPGGQGRLDGVQVSPSEGEERAGRVSCPNGGILFRSGNSTAHGAMSSSNRAEFSLVEAFLGITQWDRRAFLDTISCFVPNYHQRNIHFFTYHCSTALQLFGQ